MASTKMIDKQPFRIRATLDRARRVREESGWRGLWFGALAITAYRRLTLIERGLDRPVEPARPAMPLDTGALGPSHEGAYHALRPESPPGLFRQRLDLGEVCIGAWSDGRLLAAGWLVSDRAPVPYLGKELPLESEDAWSYDGFTHPALRRRGIGTARLARLLEEASALGARRVLAAVLPENRDAFGPTDRTGWRPIATVRAVRLRPESWTILSPRFARDGRARLAE
jgi:GNAT superfamily N-acetyltransferase